MLAAVLAAAAPVHGASGTWERAWGQDVIESGHPGDTGTGAEICIVAADCKVGANLTTFGGEFGNPDGVAVGQSGQVYVADSSRNRIQEFTADGAFVRAWGRDVVQSGKPGDTGTGFEICAVAADCQAGLAGSVGGEFSDPEHLGTDGAGNVYVADLLNNRIQKFTPAGAFVTTWGRNVSGGGVFETCSVRTSCGAGSAGTLGGELNHPFGLAVAGGGVYVTDLNNQRVQKYTTAGAFDRTWGLDVIQTGHSGDLGAVFEVCAVAADCQAATSSSFGLGGEFDGVNGVAADASGNVYVTDIGDGRVQRFTAAGGFLRTWGKDVIQSGHPGDTGTGFEVCVVAADCKNGTGGTLGGEFDTPEGLAVGPGGEVYVGDIGGSHRVQRFSAAGSFESAWGRNVIQPGAPGDAGIGFEVCTIASSCQGGASGGLGGEFSNTDQIAANGSGAILVADPNGHRVQKFSDPLSSQPGAAPAAGTSNEFSIGKLKGRKLTLNLASAGRVDVRDASVNHGRATISASRKRLKHSHVSGGPGTVTVTLKLTRRAKQILAARGKVKVKAKITFAPSGGSSSSKVRKLKVKK